MDVKAGLEALIQAAQFLEENGATNTGAEVDVQTSGVRKRTPRHRSKKPSPYSRTTHNLLEKNRRAQLRDCLEVLRQHVPFPDKLTTLALLQSARKYIEALKQKEKEENQMLSELQRSQTILLTRLAELGAGSQLLPALTALTDQSGPSNSPPTVSPQVVPTAEQTGVEKQVTTNCEEEDNMVIDVMHDSEDETSSTTSGSDGGCTSTSHKSSSNYEYH